MSPSHTTTLSRAWNAYDAYLFDIDGTLLVNDDAVHYFAFCRALKMLSGRSLNLDGVTAHGNTDVGILRDALSLADVPQATWRPYLAEACAEMGHFVTSCQAELRVRVLPGVIDLLEHLHRRGAILGVGTGNLQVIGECKLKAAGIFEFFTTGSFSDHLEYRSDVFRRAIQSVHEQIGEDASICILGDTPEDLRAARLNNVDSVATATGIYSFEDLLGERPNACVHTFLDLVNQDKS